MSIKLINKANSTRFFLSAVQPIKYDKKHGCRVCTTGTRENKAIYTTDCLDILKEVR